MGAIGGSPGSVAVPAGAATAVKQDVGNASLASIDTKLTSPIAVSQSGAWSVAATQSGTWNITNISGTISLPTGASTSALQTTGNTSLSSIDGKFGSLGQKTMAGSAPMVIASDQSAIPSSQSGTWNITNISGTISLPTGAATSALQTTGNTSLASIDTKTPALGQALMAASSPVVIASNQSAIPVSQSGTWSAGRTWTLSNATDSVAAVQSGTWNITNISGTISLPTGAATSAKQPALGTAGTASTDVITVQGIASMTALKVDGSGVTQPVSGTVAVTQSTSPWVTSRNWSLASGTDSVAAAQSGTWNITNISGTVSLPTGASTAAKQPALGTAGTASADVITVQGIASMTALKVDGSAVTQPVSGIVSSKTALTASSPTTASVGTSSASAVASNASRKGLVLTNTSANTISFGLGATAVLNSGITLYPGGVWSMDEFTFTTAAINAIAGAAASGLGIQEFT